MGYDFRPKNKAAGDFALGAFTWPVLLEAAGYLFPSIHSGGQYYAVTDTDPRFRGDYPGILANDGFKVTADEARILARIARNFVAIQRSLPEEHRSQELMHKAGGITRDDLIAALTGPGKPAVWPAKVRDDFVEKVEQFAAWAEKSGGFEIW